MSGNLTFGVKFEYSEAHPYNC